jgi:hypothetical protein
MEPKKGRSVARRDMVGTIFGIENIEKRKEKYSVVIHDIVENDIDICIIGSGAAGAVIAQKLASEGKSVVLLEKGGYYDSEDMNQREVDMMPLLWKNGGANFTDNLRIVIAQGQCLGGSTVINDAVCLKLLPLSENSGKRWVLIYRISNGIQLLMKYGAQFM